MCIAINAFIGIIFILLLYENGFYNPICSYCKKAEDIIEIAERLYTETASVKRERSMIIYKSIACLTKSFYAQWYYLSKTERLYLRKAFLTKSFWIKSILYSANLKYIAVVVSLLLNIRVMHLAKYNFQNK